ncbi:MAG: helix-hairpin-helix domain-containing protein [Bacteroidales bacterium]|nr:helix-hairpin-helix domain-containing protein [Bacteroidales bacterium]
MEEGKKKRKALSASFVTGAIALVFLIIGYEVAVFIHKAAVTRIEANRDHPDTVYVYVNSDEDGAEGETLSGAFARTGLRSNAEERVSPSASQTVRHNAKHSPVVEAVRARSRRVESFRFNPNTVSVEDLQRLGFSEKQALAIDNYRLKGGRFRRKEDFAKSYVVADSVYDRLEPYITIPKMDINKADSTELLDLPGIGPYFAGKIVSYRTSLRGYSTPEQLMEIYHFDREKYDGLKDLITCSDPEPYPIWTLSEDELSKHPHISRTEAHSIVLYREHHTPSECTFEGLRKAGTLSQEHAGKLSLCKLQSAAAPKP